MKRYAVATFGALLLAVLLISSAEAHAGLVTSTPAAGALLEAAPAEMVLEFSEDLDPAFSRVQLFNSAGQLVNPGPGTVDPATPRVLRLALAALPRDSYTAVWRARSATDGHVTEGNVPFGVGVASAAAALTQASAPDPALAAPPVPESAARWLSLLALAVMLGSLPFGLLVWRPALRSSTLDDQQRGAADHALIGTLRRLMLLGGGLFLLTQALLLLVQAASAAGVSLPLAFGGPAVQLLGTRSGLLLLARVALTLGLLALAWRLPPLHRRVSWRWWAATLLGGGLLLLWSLQSHGAAVEQNTALSVALDWLHLAAMVAWLGGLLPLVATVRLARRAPAQALPLAALIPRFSRLALASVLLLTLTGVYSYVQHINRLDLLAATTYGRALLLKVGVFAVLLLIGGVNLLILSPRLRAAGNQLAVTFGRTARAEVLLGALLLLLAGVMTSVAPSQAAWAAHERPGLVESARVGDVNLVLRVAPAQVGENAFVVEVDDPRAGAQSAPTKLLLRFTSLDMDMGTLQADAAPVDQEQYAIQGSYLSMDGRWQIEVILRRAGFEDVRHTFDVQVGQVR